MKNKKFRRKREQEKDIREKVNELLNSEKIILAKRYL